MFKNLFGNVTEVSIPKNGSKKSKHLKILVEINLDRPLLRGSKIQHNGQVVCAEFKYENLTMFCFYCGKSETFKMKLSNQKV